MILILILLIIIGVIKWEVLSKHTFQDIQNGKIVLNAEETEALKNLLADAGIQHKKFRVFIDRSKYEKAILKHKIFLENGHVTDLRFNNTNLKNMDLISAFSELRILDLSANPIGKISGLQNAKKLEELYLIENKIKEPKGIEQCVSLKLLKIQANELQDVPNISTLPNLERLFLAYNKINSLKHFKGGDSLTTLDLSLNQLTTLDGLPDLPNLAYLYLNNNQLTSLEGMKDLPKLVVLRLENNQLESADELKKLSLPKIVSLNLKNNKLKILPKFNKKIEMLEADKNLLEIPAQKKPAKPEADIILDNKAPRVSSLPLINGTLSGGGLIQKEFKTNSSMPGATPTSFRYAQEERSLTGTSGFHIILGNLLNVESARVNLSVEKGRVRVYLKHPGDHKYVNQKYYKNIPQMVATEDFIYADAIPGKPCSLQGILLSPKYAKYDIILEALDGSASGVSYEATDIN